MKFQYKILCIILGSLIVYSLAMYNTEEKEYILSYNGVKLNVENAPGINPIFKEKKLDPHIKFVSNDNCLACHKNGAVIPNFGKSPVINHQIINDNCNICHINK